MRAGLLLESKPEVGSALKSPARKWRNSATLGSWGVGASGSTIATTNEELLLEPDDPEIKEMVGGMDVSKTKVTVVVLVIS